MPVDIALELEFTGGSIVQNGDLSVDIRSCNVDLAGVQSLFPGAVDQPVVDDITNYFWLDLNATLQTSTVAYPSTGAVRLGRVVTLNGFIQTIQDDRAFLGGSSLSLSGAGNPNGVQSASFGSTYRDSLNDVWYRCVSNPSGTDWTVV